MICRVFYTYRHVSNIICCSWDASNYFIKHFSKKAGRRNNSSTQLKLYEFEGSTCIGRCRHNAKIIAFFLGVQRCDTLYSRTLFMSLNCLLQGLSFLQTVFAVVPHCFACFVAYQDVNGYDFGLSVVMILLNQV